MDLFDKVTSLLGEEQMSIREYTDILDAGFSAAKVGMIPPGNDRVTVGDIERTRLNHIRILFFVGVNDGIVPKAGSTGSIISQFEREKMAEHHLMLAPGGAGKSLYPEVLSLSELNQAVGRIVCHLLKGQPGGKGAAPVLSDRNALQYVPGN